MAITEPGCGSDPSLVQTTATLDGDDWVLNGEKIFVTTGCRADGVVVWATVDKSAGRAGIKSFLVEKGTPGFDRRRTRRRSSASAPTTPRPTSSRTAASRASNLLGGDETVAKEGSGGFRAS